MSLQENMAVQAIAGELGVTKDFDRFNEVFHEDVDDHDAAPGAPAGVEGIKQWWQELRVAFPDFKLDVDIIFGDDDNIAFAYRLSGTHQGEFLGFAATGKHFEVRSLQINHFKDRKVSDRYGSTDILGILTQLGLVKLPEMTHSTGS